MFYWIAKQIVRLVTRILYRITIVGLDNVPDKGGGHCSQSPQLDGSAAAGFRPGTPGQVHGKGGVVQVFRPCMAAQKTEGLSGQSVGCRPDCGKGSDCYCVIGSASRNIPRGVAQQGWAASARPRRCSSGRNQDRSTSRTRGNTRSGPQQPRPGTATAHPSGLRKTDIPASARRRSAGQDFTVRIY